MLPLPDRPPAACAVARSAHRTYPTLEEMAHYLKEIIEYLQCGPPPPCAFCASLL